MKNYEIKILVKGNTELKHALEKGFIQDGIRVDVLPDEEILSISYQEITE